MSDYFKHVVYIGPEHNQRGGIASVLHVYAQTIRNFNFIPSYYNRSFGGNIVDFFRAFFQLVQLLISNKDIRVLHLHCASKGSFLRKSILLLTGKMFGRKTVMHIHSGGFREFYNSSYPAKLFIRYILNLTDEVVCLSDEWKLYFDSIVKQPHSIVVNNPVVLPATVHIKPVGRPCNVLYLNHLVATKGIFDLINFFGQHKQWLTGRFNLIIAGDGDRDAMTQLISKHDLHGIICYKGWVSGTEKDSLIAESDVFILPSYFEGLPMSILESMALGKPIIATNVGGIPRVVHPGQNGWLIEPGNLEGLEAAFRQIDATPDILNNFGRQSMEIVQHYSPEEVANQLNTIYAKLI